MVSVYGILIKAYPGGDGHVLYFNYDGGLIGTHSYQSSLLQFVVCRLFLNKAGKKKYIPEAQYQLFFFSPFFLCSSHLVSRKTYRINRFSHFHPDPGEKK